MLAAAQEAVIRIRAFTARFHIGTARNCKPSGRPACTQERPQERYA